LQVLHEKNIELRDHQSSPQPGKTIDQDQKEKRGMNKPDNLRR
jgi:hypothetical protein